MASDDLKKIKKILKEESPELVAQLMANLIEHNRKLEARIEAIEKQQKEKDQSAFAMEEQVKLLRRSLFGKSSETRTDSTDRPRDKSQTEALLFSQAAFPAEVSRDEKTNKWASLSIQEINHHLSDAELNEEAGLRGVENPQPSMWKNTGLYKVLFYRCYRFKKNAP